MNGAAVKVLLALVCGTICWVGWAASSVDTSKPHTSKPGEKHDEGGESIAAVDGGVDASAGDPQELVPELIAVEGMRIARMVVARGVNRTEKDRVPLEPGTSFEADGRRVYVFLVVDNPEETEGAISVGWLPPERKREIGTVSVEVKPSKRWRTWAYNKYINSPGIWHAVVRNISGEIIARAPFEMTVPQPSETKSQ